MQLTFYGKYSTSFAFDPPTQSTIIKVIIMIPFSKIHSYIVVNTAGATIKYIRTTIHTI